LEVGEMWMNWDSGWGGWFATSVGMVVFWGLVIWAIVAVVRSTDRRSDAPKPDVKSPQSILEERYARGEIDEAEFIDRRDVLTGRKAG
jgi:putative membrane protein